MQRKALSRALHLIDGGGHPTGEDGHRRLVTTTMIKVFSGPQEGGVLPELMKFRGQSYPGLWCTCWRPVKLLMIQMTMGMMTKPIKKPAGQHEQVTVNGLPAAPVPGSHGIGLLCQIDHSSLFLQWFGQGYPSPARHFGPSMRIPIRKKQTPLPRASQGRGGARTHVLRVGFCQFGFTVALEPSSGAGGRWPPPDKYSQSQ